VSSCHAAGYPGEIRERSSWTALTSSSGHGTSVEDTDGDEHDDDDEGDSLNLRGTQLTVAICPVDYEEAGLIIDDDSELALPRSV
jgi:hypothetical protein